MLVAMPVAAAGATDTTGGTVDLEPSGATGVAGSYIEYFEKNYDVKKVVSKDTVVEVGVSDAYTTEIAGAETKTDGGLSGIVLESDVKDKDGNLVTDKNEWIEWQVDVPVSGLYNLTPTYYPLVKSGRAISVKVTIDGVAPFVEAQTLSLPRIWKDKVIVG